MIKVKDGYGKLIGSSYLGSSIQVLLSNGGDLAFSSGTKASTLVKRDSSSSIYATYFNSAISDETLSDIGSVYVRNTSDSFIRRISKDQFYSIIDDKFVTLDTNQTITGTKTFSTSPILTIRTSIILNLESSSNYTLAIKWLKGGTSLNTFDPQIGLHNIGGGGIGSITILPYPTSTIPWGGNVGLFVSKGILKLDGKDVLHSGNYDLYLGYIGTTKVLKSSATQALTGISSIDIVGNRYLIDDIYGLNLNNSDIIGANGIYFLDVVNSVGKGINFYRTSSTWDTLAAANGILYFSPNRSTSTHTLTPVFSSLTNSGNNISLTIGGTNRTLLVGYSSNSSMLNGYGLTSFIYRTVYNYPTGCLVTTNIPKTSDAMVVVDIIGNGYTVGTVINTKVLLYQYNTRDVIISYSAINFGYNFGDIYAFDYNGYLCLWFKLLLVYQSFIVFVYLSNKSNSTIGINRVNSIKNSELPTDGVTRKVTITPVSALTLGIKVNGGSYIPDSSTTYKSGSTGYITIPDYVTALGTNGNYLTWTKGSTTNNLTVPYANISDKAYFLLSHDTRDVNNTPGIFASGARFEFKKNSTDGLKDGGTYHGILHFKPYGSITDFSGGLTHLLGFTDNGNLYMRTSTSSTEWGSWKPILSLNTADGRYVKVAGDTMTGALIVNSTITGTLLISTVANGTAPLEVTSTTVVTNLNADLLDGYHETLFYRYRGLYLHIESSIPTKEELSDDNNLSGSWVIQCTESSGHLIQFSTKVGSTRYVQFYSFYNKSLYWRNSTDSTLNTKPWRTIVDSANYTEIVLKVGTVTKGSATLPIYLNAGTPTACSTTLEVSITGNAKTANRLYRIDENNKTWTTANSVVGNGIVGYADPVTSGRWDNYGSIFLFSNHNDPNPGTDDHWLTQIWSVTTNKLGVRWRTNTGSWSAILTILTNSNYTTYTVTKTGSGASGTWDISITGTASRLISNLISDTLANKTTPGCLYHAGGDNSVKDKPSGVDAFGVFTMLTANGYYGQLLISSNESTGLYWRTAISYNGGWRKVIDSSNYTEYVNPANYVISLGTSDNYLTWVKNGVTNNIIIPYATKSLYTTGFYAEYTNKWDCNNPDRVVYSSFDSSNREITHAPSGWTYGTLLELGHTNLRGLGGNLNMQLMWDVADNTTKAGTLWFRTKDPTYGWDKNWAKIITDLNISAILNDYYTKTESDGKYVTLTTSQTVSGIKTFSTQLKFTVATGTSPFTVSSTTVVSNLNSDMLDGRHSGEFMWFNSLEEMRGYYSYVIGLVRLSTIGKRAAGRIYLARVNILYNPVYIDYILGAAYSTGSSPYTVYGTVVCYGRAYPVVTFKYNGEYYAGFKLYAYNAQERPYVETSIRDIDPFIVAYYNNYDKAVINSEVNDSISTTTRVSVTNRIYGVASSVVGTLTLSSGKFISETYNGETNTTVNIPTNTSHLTNDSGYWAGTLTFSSGKFSAKTYNGTGNETVNIPTSTSHLTNDSGFWTGTRYWANVKVSDTSSTTTVPTFAGANVYGNINSDYYMLRNNSDNPYLKLVLNYNWYIQAYLDDYLYLGAGYTKSLRINYLGNTYTPGTMSAANGFYHPSVNSNSYVLLAGGSYKALTAFVTGNAGSATKGVYVTGGVVTAMTYSLNSNVNSGTSGKLTYYSGSNTLSSYTGTVGSDAKPIYINAGTLSASSYSFTGTLSNPVIMWCGEIYRNSTSSTYWYSTKKGGCCDISFTTNNANSSGNLVISISHCEPYAAFCSTVEIYNGSSVTSASGSTVDGRSPGMGDYMTTCSVSGTTGKVYIRKFRMKDKNNDSWTNEDLKTTKTTDDNRPVMRFYLMIVGRYI